MMRDCYLINHNFSSGFQGQCFSANEDWEHYNRNSRSPPINDPSHHIKFSSGTFAFYNYHVRSNRVMNDVKSEPIDSYQLSMILLHPT